MRKAYLGLIIVGVIALSAYMVWFLLNVKQVKPIDPATVTIDSTIGQVPPAVKLLHVYAVPAQCSEKCFDCDTLAPGCPEFTERRFAQMAGSSPPSCLWSCCKDKALRANGTGDAVVCCPQGYEFAKKDPNDPTRYICLKRV